MHKSIFFILFWLIKTCFSQEIQIIAKIEPKDRFYLEYLRSDSVTAESFAIDSSFIYLENFKLFERRNTYKWQYKQPFSKSNPSQIVDFSALQVMKINNSLLNVALQFYDLNTGEKLSVLADSGDYAVTFDEHVKYAYYDSTVYYFWLSGNLGRKAKFFCYDMLNQQVKHIPIPNYMNYIGEEYGVINCILFSNNILFSVVTLYSKKPKGIYKRIISWNVFTDQRISEFEFDIHISRPKFIGEDKNQNIYLFSGVDNFEHRLYIFSQELKLQKIINMRDEMLKLPFMKDNDFIIADAGRHSSIVCAFDDNKELYLMVKTIKGIYFLRYKVLLDQK